MYTDYAGGHWPISTGLGHEDGLGMDLSHGLN